MFGLFSIWSTLNSVLFYLSFAVSLAGLVGNALLLWHVGLHVRKGPFNTYVLHVAAADFLFLGCQVGFSFTQVATGSQHSLHFPVVFLWFAVGLWLLAAFSLDCCLTHLLPSCCRSSCRPRYTSVAVCILIWALTMPAVLLPANACGLLHNSMRLLTCLSYHWTSVIWLGVLGSVACGASMVLFVHVTFCFLQQPPKFYRVVRCSGILLFLFRLPMVFYWSMRAVLNLLLPIFLPLALLLACVDSSSKPLLYYLEGRQLGKREPLRVVLNRALGEQPQLSLRGVSLPMSPV